MLKLLFMVCIILGSNLSLAADFWTEVQTTKSGSVSWNQVNVGFSGGREALGYYSFGQSLSNGYQQIYAGPKVNPTDWLEIGVAIGAEKTASSDWTRRAAGYFWMGREKISLLGVYENGDTGPWHKVVLNYKVTPDLTVGIQAQAFFGTGIRAEYALGRNFSLWGMVLKNGNVSTTTIALKTNF